MHISAYQPHLDQQHKKGASKPPHSSTAKKNHADAGASFSYSQIPLASKAAVGIQAKTTMSQPGDRFEREADHIAGQVMRMPQPQVQRSCSCGGQCPKCQAKHKEGGAKHLSSPSVQGMPSIVNRALRTSGQPLDPTSRSFFEPRFGYEFSGVRIHSGPVAADAARSIGAEAFTVGNSIVMGKGNGASTAGRELLAHELTHTVQQGAAAPIPNATQQSAPSPTIGATNVVQRRTLGIAGACWFENCQSQLNNFFMIHEDGLPGFHPSGTGSSFRVDDVDGLWFKYHTPKTEWFKIPDIGTGWVTCNDDEQSPSISSPIIPFATAGWTDDGIHTANPY